MFLLDLCPHVFEFYNIFHTIYYVGRTSSHQITEVFTAVAATAQGAEAALVAVAAVGAL